MIEDKHQLLFLVLFHWCMVKKSLLLPAPDFPSQRFVTVNIFERLKVHIGE